MLTSILKYSATTIALLIVSYIVLILFFPIKFTQTVDLDASLPAVTLNHYKFHAQTFGDANHPIIIAIHGGPGGDHRAILPLKKLSDQYFIVFYDQRMSGLSSRNSTVAITVQSFYDDLNAFVDHYAHGKPVHLVGHSWGAMMASGYAGLYPEKVEKIILIEPGILRADLSEQFLNQSPPEFSLVDYMNISKIWLNQWRVKTDKDQHARKDYFISMLYLYLGERQGLPVNNMGWRMGAYVVDETLGRCEREPKYLKSLNFLSGVENFDGETLFLSSENNTVYGAEYQKQHLNYFKHASEKIINHSGHNIFIEQADQSNKIIRAFLKGDAPL